jgi:8-oxo-dGTP diphosphatase
VSREYPDYPRVGVGAVVLHRGCVLLVRRGGQPSMGKWTLPGGLVEVGETTAEAVRREIREECSLDIRVIGIAGVIDRVVRDPDGRVHYHYVLVDYLAYAESDAIEAASDAAEAQWVELDRVKDLEITDGLIDMIERAVVLASTAQGA